MSENKKVQKYVAISPDEFISELKALNKGVKPKPKVRVFEGKQGVAAAIENSLDCKEKLVRIYTDQKFKKIDTKKFDKSILVLKNRQVSTIDIIICDNKISYILPDQNASAIIIENKEAAETMKSVFDLAYEGR